LFGSTSESGAGNGVSTCSGPAAQAEPHAKLAAMTRPAVIVLNI
jgi:hypothetical protein